MSLKSWDASIIDVVRRFMAEQIPFNKHVGFEVASLAEGFARLEVPYRPELIGDPFRPALHGGVISALIDACGGAAVFTVVNPPTDRVSTIDLRVDYLRPGEPKRLACEARVERLGNRTASVDMKVFHPEAASRLIASGRGVYNVRRAKP